MQYLWQPAASVLSVAPLTGPVSGGTNITVVGTNFIGTTVRCVFGSSVVMAQVATPTLLFCTSPSSSAGSVAVEISNNQQDYTNNGVQFTYQLAASVASLLPTSGPVNGSTVVTVTGTNFVSSSQLYCSFVGVGRSLATWVSASTLRCLSPARTAGSVALEVSNNNQDFTSNAVQFMYQETAAVLGIVPAFGPVTGGTTVTVTGQSFVSGNLYCRFGASIVAANYTSASRAICTAPANPVSVVAVEMSNNNQDYTVSNVPFGYQAVATVTQLQPISGSVNGGTNVTISGSNFVGVVVYCRFGTIEGIASSKISTTRVACIAPAGTLGNAPVDISNNNQDYTNNGVLFNYQDDKSVTQLVPTTGPVTGSTVVTVIGSNFVNTPGLYCRFGTLAAVQGLWQTASVMTCLSPSSVPGTVAVEVSNNNQDFTANSVQYIYQQTTNVTSIVPASGPVTGGTVVTVRGNNFVVGNIYCAFGSSRVAASFNTSTLVLCTSPAHVVGNVRLEISPNNQDYTVNSTLYVFQSIVQITKLTPPNGPVTGGTVVTVAGNNFVNATTLQCIFGSNLATVVTFNSVSEIQCAAPAAAAGTASVDITLNGQDYTALYVPYRYDAVIGITQVKPSTGPQSGGTLVTLIGTNFLNSPLTLCRFGTVPRNTTWLGATAVTCFAPAAQSTGNVSIEATNNAQDYTNFGFLFRYDASATVTALNPAYGVRDGGSLVTVTGTNFQNLNTLFCRFGNTKGLAVYVTATEIVCTAPAVAAAGFVAVEVTNNDLDYTFDNVQFQYLPTQFIVAVSAIDPASGPTAGGTLVTVNGDNYVLGSTFCRFGLASPVTGTWVSTSRVLCISPAQVAGFVALEVAVNGTGQFTNNGVVFRYEPAPVVTQISPAFGSVIGATSVQVAGLNFVSRAALACRFGTSVVSANFLTSTSLSCLSPAHPAANVTVEVTNNGPDYSSNGLVFTYMNDANISSITPTTGPTSGSTLVTVFGNNFVSTALLQCIFGVLKVPATLVTSTQVTCYSPSQPAAAVLVVVTSNNVDFTNSSAVFVYTASSSVVSVTPGNGPVTGGVLVTVGGTGFINQTMTAALEPQRPWWAQW